MAPKENKLSKIDKTILDNFYKLVHSEQHVRLRASLSTYKILTSMKKNKPNSFNEHLNYCIERLVTGLASSRAFARRGYATLLLELLKNHQVSTERLLSIAQQKFGNISNETTADNLLGYFLLITIIIDSGNYKRSKQNAIMLEKMLKYLIQLKNIKSYFEHPVSKLLTEQYDLFYPHLLANISPESLGSGNRITHTDLLILVLCNKKQAMREFTGLDTAAVANLSSCLLNDSLQRRPLHPLWIEFGRILIELMPQHFESFYNDILKPTFFKSNHNELASMGLELTVQLLESTNDANLIKIILSDHVIQTLIVSLRTKTPLRTQCLDFFKTLSLSFKSSPKESIDQENDLDTRQFHILNRLTASPGSVAFDEDSKSRSIISLLNECHSSVLIKYLDKLLSILNKSFPHNQDKRLHNACARQIAYIIHRPQMVDQHATAQKLARFLIVNSFFEKSSEQKSSKKTEFQIIEHLDETTKDTLTNAYRSVMSHIASCNTLQRIENFGKLVDFVDRFLAETTKTNEELRDLWQVYYKNLKEHRELVKKNQDFKLLYPISNLYLFYGLQIIEHHLDCQEQLDDLIVCSKEALKNDPNDGSWADVLTDQLIAILSATECPPWVRKLCVSIFGSLLPHISETAIDLIYEASRAPPDEPSDEEQEDEQQNGCEKRNDGVSDRNELEPRQEDQTEVNMSVDEGRESEEESEHMDDDQMFTLDSALAEMFKLKKKKKFSKHDEPHLRIQELVKKILTKKKNIWYKYTDQASKEQTPA